ncbi:hypothetical protein [Clostridium saccharoperbutylacetonicum]|uniref:DUF7210 family protein n=1 Tax=Clostridium saccharoperbutylacetonicum TaxID=36745 RepID=UPI000983E27B|nr:hypothetical protein [Clostridium saccharoperbutylacetonicum]AQR95560.1 hypothetical protein CLSAP_28760 [Clostridium saccharoperbutylacetonicum]NSB31420.1 hypothetical protein [Clostridium saccharoperbutylacetonicum]
MAGKNEKQTNTDVIEKVEETTYKAIAKQFIKYDGKFLADGDEFQVKESDVKELKAFAHIDIPKEAVSQEIVPPVDPGAGQEEGKVDGENGGQ